VLRTIGSGLPGEIVEELTIWGQYGGNVITRYEIIDAHGKECTPNTGWDALFYKGRETLMKFAEELPADVQLRLTVHRDPQVVRIPFVFKNLAVGQTVAGTVPVVGEEGLGEKTGDSQ
jgi:hypothetical protein